MTTIDLVYFNAGGGHRAAAMALEAVIAQQRRPWNVRLVNLVDMVDPDGRFRRLTGRAPEDYYNRRLAKGLTFGMKQELRLLQAVIRLGHAKLIARLEAHWLRTEPDLVVSLIPNFNRSLCQSLANVLPGVPYATVLTDLADYPPDFWIQPDLPQHLVCGTARAAEQALAMGCRPERIHRTSGMIIRPDFYGADPTDRRAGQALLGLDPDRPVGLVLFGGHGSRQMVSIARQLDGVQLILMCGHNVALADTLRATPAAACRHVVGFTPDVSRYMRLADFFIGKPGPGSISEALQQGLPIVTVRNRWTMPQERYNTEWLVENRLGLVGSSMRRLRPVVEDLLSRLDAFRRQVKTIRNRAVFELPDILEGLIAQASRSRLEHRGSVDTAV